MKITVLFCMLVLALVNSCDEKTRIVGIEDEQSMLLCPLRPKKSIVQWIWLDKNYILSTGTMVNQMIERSHRYKIVGDASGEYNLLINRTEFSDRGRYRCEIINEAQSCTVILVVKEGRIVANNNNKDENEANNGFNLFAGLGMFMAICILLILIGLLVGYIMYLRQCKLEANKIHPKTEEQPINVWKTKSNIKRDNGLKQSGNETSYLDPVHSSGLLLFDNDLDNTNVITGQTARQVPVTLPHVHNVITDPSRFDLFKTSSVTASSAIYAVNDIVSYHNNATYLHHKAGSVDNMPSGINVQINQYCDLSAERNVQQNPYDTMQNSLNG